MKFSFFPPGLEDRPTRFPKRWLLMAAGLKLLLPGGPWSDLIK